MRIRKFNVAAAGVLLVVVLAGWQVVGIFFGGSPVPTVSTDDTATKGVQPMSQSVGNKVGNEAAPTKTDSMSPPAGQHVTLVPWVSAKGKAPADVKLEKWYNLGRIYFRMTGPKSYRLADENRQVYFHGCLAYFPRQGADYDEWIIREGSARVLQFHKDRIDDRSRSPLGVSPLPAGQFQIDGVGDRISVTFWCVEGDGPGNIVFMYDRDDDPIFVCTANHQPSGDWDNHRAGLWTYP